MFRPQAPFSTAMKLLIPTTTKVKGVVKKTYTDPSDADVFFGAFRTFSGTESTSNDVYTVFDTGVVDCWYNPNISSNCRIYICETGAIYDIVGTPENIDMRHQYLQFRVQRAGGEP